MSELTRVERLPLDDYYSADPRTPDRTTTSPFPMLANFLQDLYAAVSIAAFTLFLVALFLPQLRETFALDSATLASFRWRPIGPANMAGRIADVVGIPSPSKTFYVATVAGGIWKTTNGGSTWTKLTGNGLPPGTYGRIALDVSRSKDVKRNSL